MSKQKIPGVRAWAWKCDFGLCQWAEPSRTQLIEDSDKPSSEAKPVLVRLIEETELRRLVKAAEAKGE